LPSNIERNDRIRSESRIECDRTRPRRLGGIRSLDQHQSICFWHAHGDRIMFGIDQLADRKTGDPLLARWPAISPRDDTIGQLITDPELAGVLVQDDDVGAAISIEIACAKEFLRRLINERRGTL